MPKQFKRRRQNVSRQSHHKNFESTSYLSSIVSSSNTPFIKSLCCTAKFSEKSCVQLTTSTSVYNFPLLNSTQKETIDNNIECQQKVSLENQSIRSYISLKPLSQKNLFLDENHIHIESKHFDTKSEIER